MAKHLPPVPAWLVGLILAALLFALVLVVASALGYGDDPVIDGMAAALG